MDFFWPYAALLFSAFTSATILLGTSELGLGALVHAQPQHWPLALAVATLGNTAGSMVSYAMGRWLPERYLPNERVMARLQRYGAWALLLAWVPLVGDALPLAAGWLRLRWWACLLMLLVGKTVRYAALVWAVLQAVS